jgi:hypothetical protein
MSYETTLKKFRDELDGYDDPVINEIRESLTNPWEEIAEPPELTPGEWKDALKRLSDTLYVKASEIDRTGYGDDTEIHWYIRHNGEEWEYATDQLGVVHTGGDAERQIAAVLRNHDGYPMPMETWAFENGGDEE